MSLINRNRIKSGTSTDENNRNYWYLEQAVRRACMDSKQSGNSVVKELASMITPMVEELQKIVLSETATVDEKLAAGSLAQQILGKAVLAESSARKRSVARLEDKGRKARLELRKQAIAERKAKKHAKIEAQLEEARRQIEGSK
jgi:hypothetical protein